MRSFWSQVVLLSCYRSSHAAERRYDLISVFTHPDLFADLEHLSLKVVVLRKCKLPPNDEITLTVGMRRRLGEIWHMTE